MHIHRDAAIDQRGVEVAGDEEAAPTVEHDGLPREQSVPVPSPHALGEHGVEERAARGRQRKAALAALARCLCGRGPRACTFEVGVVAAESLRAEIIRHSVARDGFEPSLDPGSLSAPLADRQHEAICAMRPGSQLAAVPRRREDRITFAAPCQAVLDL
jgi:hypothetical protein